MTIRRTGAVQLAVLLAAAPVVAAQGGKWIAATCDIKPGHFLVNSGVLYLKSAAEGRYPEQITKDLRDAQRTLTQAITSGGQDKNPAAWYYLGRYYVVMKDGAGADSAFRRAEQLAPTCKADINNFRRNQLWVPLYNQALASYNAGKSDSAIALLQQANAVYAGEPTGFNFLGQLFYNADQPDSAAKYFRLAVDAASDPKYASEKRDAMFNIAASYARAQRWPEAATAYHDYLAAVPNDARALAGLGAAFTAMGKADSALAVFRGIVDRADSVDAMALFYAGTSIFASAPPLPDTGATGSSCRAEARRSGRALTARAIAVRCDSATARQVREYDASVASTYRLAAKSFEAGLAKNPFYRDGLFNLTNTYLALRDTTAMLPAARRLYALDPLNRSTLRLLAQAFQFQRKPDSTLHYLSYADSVMPVEVAVGSFQPSDQSASLSGVLTNFHSMPDSAVMVQQCRAAGPAATAATRCAYAKLATDTKTKLTNPPLKLTFEFLNAKGEVVATQTLDVPALEPGGNHAFQLQAIGSKIEAWRYKQS